MASTERRLRSVRTTITKIKKNDADRRGFREEMADVFRDLFHLVVCRAQVVRCTWLIRLLLLGTFSLVDLVIGPLPTAVVVFLPPPSLLVPPPLPLFPDDTFSKDFCLPGGGGDKTVIGLAGSATAGGCGGGGSSTVPSTITVT